MRHQGQLREVDSGIWEAPGSLRLLGVLELGHRITVIRSERGELVLHAPGEPTPELIDELKQLGPVRAILAPSAIHDLHLARWPQSLPHAALLGAPGLAERHPDLEFAGELTPETIGELGAGLELFSIEGMPRINERAVLHRPTRTLIVADLAFNLEEPRSWTEGLLQRLFGLHGGLRVSRLFRLMIRDRGRFRASVRRVLEQDFDRLIVGHGAIVETGARGRLRVAFDRFGI